MDFKLSVDQRYNVMCYRDTGGVIDGDTHAYWGPLLIWQEDFKNLVVTAGLNKYLDATLKTGSSTPTWYVGLKGSGTPAAGDTLASHGTWSEINPYSGNRPVWTAGTVASGSVDNSAARASFTMTSATTVYGAFMASVSTGTSGTLLGVGDFSSSRAVVTNDVLNVQVTCTLTAS